MPVWCAVADLHTDADLMQPNTQCVRVHIWYGIDYTFPLQYDILWHNM